VHIPAESIHTAGRVYRHFVSVNTTSVTDGLTLGVKLCRRPSYQVLWVRVRLGIR